MAAVAFTSVGCKDKGATGTDPGPAAAGSDTKAAAGSGAAAPAPAPPPAPAKVDEGAKAPAAAEPKVGEGPVVPAKALARHDMPPFKGVPDSALWTSVEAEKDGNKFAHLMIYGPKEGDKEGVLGLRIVDCNGPMLKDYVGKTERGDLEWCFKTPAADAPKVGEYPRMDGPDDKVVVIKVDHLVVRMSAWDEKKISKDDIAAYLATVDFKPLLAEAK